MRTITVRSAPAGAFLSRAERGPGAPVRTIASRVSRWMRIWADRRHLQALPDHMLKDIGIGRSEIDSITECGRSDASRLARSC
jgi:uncharacterized protein YjiS (DUF1127 family)